VSDVKAVVKREGRCVVAVSEGIADKKGNLIASKFLHEVDSHGNAQLSGSGALGDALAGLVREKAKIKRVRADTFGYLQRSFPGVASATDQEEARKAGIAAFEAAASGKWRSGSIAIRRKKGRKYAVSFDVVPLKSVAKETRSMPDAFIAENGHDVTDAFIAYARPLVGELPVKAML
jgi:6-phosphofructokinase 1